MGHFFFLFNKSIYHFYIFAFFFKSKGRITNKEEIEEEEKTMKKNI